jgi:hypothetical protein
MNVSISALNNFATDLVRFILLLREIAAFRASSRNEIVGSTLPPYRAGTKLTLCLSGVHGGKERTPCPP